MVSISSETPYSDILTNPFFTKAQVHAFGVPPEDSVIAEINKGGSSQDYLPIEYIRTLLDLYVGHGMYSIETELKHTEREVIKKWQGRGENRQEVENIAATAIVSVAITIQARDGSGRTLRHAAIGANTQYAGVDKGWGSIIANALYSAESAGIKKAAEKLGRAFGFDLKQKVEKENLPNSLNQIRNAMNHHHKMMVDRKALEIAGKATEAQPQLPAPQNSTEGETAVISLTAENQPAQQTAEALAPNAEPKPEAKALEPAPAREAPATEQQPTAQEAAEPIHNETSIHRGSEKPKVVQQHVGAQPVASNDAGTPSDQQSQTSEAVANWNLSVRPANYEQWVEAARTMMNRIQAMTSEREILNFIKRNAGLIENLPSLPAADGRPPRDFKRYWKHIVASKLRSFGADVPEDYQLAA